MTEPHPTGHVHLGKYHGLGNDFLVWLTDAATAAAVDLPDLARRACARHRGIGADGLLVGTPLDDAPDVEVQLHERDGSPAERIRGRHPGERGAEIQMVLHNADGSRAEMSGNGIRCFVHAVARDAGIDEGEIRVATDAGLRTVAFRNAGTDDPREIVATVDMGAAHPGPEADTGAPVPETEPEATPQRQATVEVGNPHLVLLVDDPAKVDRGVIGPKWEARYSHGINVHFVAPSADGAALTVHTWERGAGLTEACGTGASAAAAVAHDWDLVGDHVAVHMPGGDVQVHVADTISLTGPSVWIADIELPCAGSAS